MTYRCFLDKGSLDKPYSGLSQPSAETRWSNVHWITWGSQGMNTPPLFHQKHKLSQSEASSSWETAIHSSKRVANSRGLWLVQNNHVHWTTCRILVTTTAMKVSTVQGEDDSHRGLMYELIKHWLKRTVEPDQGRHKLAEFGAGTFPVFSSSYLHDRCQERCRNWPTDSYAQRFPGHVIRRLSACTCMSHRGGNSMKGFSFIQRRDP